MASVSSASTPYAGPGFRPTHVVPRDGMPAWEGPDPARPTEPLDPFLPVQVLDRVGDWSRILCSNGWSAWVDGRLLVSVPPDPPAAGSATSRAADPRPLLGRVEDSLGRYRRAAEELMAGHTDGEDFRRRTRGLRVGVVVDGEALWLYDAEHERWVYCDGRRMTTYAASRDPSASAHGAAGDTGGRGSADDRGDTGEVGGVGETPEDGEDGEDGASRHPREDGYQPTRVVEPERTRVVEWRGAEDEP
ncbi:hypothetical protein [Streptomyces sp. NPDC006368]|uniref:hypothetical protein n=1 Tax=Streptomyces sp. NPDC006368 TaxID=3156760 RepID=UPI0033BC0FA3